MSRNSSVAVLTDCTDVNLSHISFAGVDHPSSVLSIDNETVLTNNTDISPSQVIGNKSFLERVQSMDIAELFPRGSLDQKKRKKKKNCEASLSIYTSSETSSNNSDQSKKEVKNDISTFSLGNSTNEIHSNNVTEKESIIADSSDSLKNLLGSVKKPIKRNKKNAVNISLELTPDIRHSDEKNKSIDELHTDIKSNKAFNKKLYLRKKSVNLSFDSCSSDKSSVTENISKSIKRNKSRIVNVSLESVSTARQRTTKGGNSKCDLENDDLGLVTCSDLSSPMIKSFNRKSSIKNHTIDISLDSLLPSEQSGKENVRKSLRSMKLKKISVHSASPEKEKHPDNPKQLIKKNKVNSKERRKVSVQLDCNSFDQSCSNISQNDNCFNNKNNGNINATSVTNTSMELDSRIENDLICDRNKKGNLTTVSNISMDLDSRIENILEERNISDETKNILSHDCDELAHEDGCIQEKIKNILATQETSILIDAEQSVCNSSVNSHHSEKTEICHKEKICSANNLKVDTIIEKSLEGSHLELSDKSEIRKIKKTLMSKKISVCFSNDSSLDVSREVCSSLLSNNNSKTNTTRRSTRLARSKTDSYVGEIDSNLEIKDKTLEKVKGIVGNTNESISKNIDNTIFIKRKLKKDTASRKVSVVFGLDSFDLNDTRTDQFSDDNRDMCTKESNVIIQVETIMDNKKQDLSSLLDMKNSNHEDSSVNNSIDEEKNPDNPKWPKIKKALPPIVSVHFAPDATMDVSSNLDKSIEHTQSGGLNEETEISLIQENENDKKIKTNSGMTLNVENNDQNTGSLSVTKNIAGVSQSYNIVDSPKRQEIRSTLASRKVSVHFDYDTSIQTDYEGTGTEIVDDSSQRICKDIDCTSESSHNKQSEGEQFDISVKSQKGSIAENFGKDLEKENILPTSNVGDNHDISEGVSKCSQSENNISLNNKSYVMNECENNGHSECIEDKIRKALDSSYCVTDPSINSINSCVSTVEKNNSEITPSLDSINQNRSEISINKTVSEETKLLGESNIFTVPYEEVSFKYKFIEGSHLSLPDNSEYQESKKIQKTLASRKVSVCIEADPSMHLRSNCDSLLPENNSITNKTIVSNTCSKTETYSDLNLNNTDVENKELEQVREIVETTNESISKSIVFKGRKLKKDAASRKVSVAFGLKSFNLSDNKTVQFNEDKGDMVKNESYVIIQGETIIDNKQQDISSLSEFKNSNEDSSVNNSFDEAKIHDGNPKTLKIKKALHPRVSVHFAPDATMDASSNFDENRLPNSKCDNLLKESTELIQTFIANEDKEIDSIEANENDKELKKIHPIGGTMSNVENNDKNIGSLSVTNATDISRDNIILDDHSPKRQEIRSTLASRKVSVQFDNTSIQTDYEGTGTEIVDDGSQRICKDIDCTSESNYNKHSEEEQFEISVKSPEDCVAENFGKDSEKENILPTSNVVDNHDISEGVSKCNQSENNISLNNKSTGGNMMNECEKMYEREKEHKEKLPLENACEQNSSHIFTDTEGGKVRHSECIQDKIRKVLVSEQISSNCDTDPSINSVSNRVSAVEKNNSEINTSLVFINQNKCDLINKIIIQENQQVELSDLNLLDNSENQESKIIKKTLASRKVSICIEDDPSINLISNCDSILPDNNTKTNIIRRSTRLSRSKTDSFHEGIVNVMGEKVKGDVNESVSKSIVFKGRKLKKDAASRKVSVAFGLESFNLSDNKTVQFDEDKGDLVKNESYVIIQGETIIDHKQQDISSLSEFKNSNEDSSVNNSFDEAKIHDGNPKSLKIKKALHPRVSVHFAPDATMDASSNFDENRLPNSKCDNLLKESTELIQTYIANEDKEIDSIEANENDKELKQIHPIGETMPNVENNDQNTGSLSVTKSIAGVSQSYNIVDSPKRQEIRSTLASRKVSVHFDNTSIQTDYEGAGTEIVDDGSQRICKDIDCSSESNYNKHSEEEQFEISVKYPEDGIEENFGKDSEKENILPTSNVGDDHDISEGGSKCNQSENNINLNNKSANDNIINEYENMSEREKQDEEKFSLENSSDQQNSKYLPQEIGVSIVSHSDKIGKTLASHQISSHPATGSAINLKSSCASLNEKNNYEINLTVSDNRNQNEQSIIMDGKGEDLEKETSTSKLKEHASLLKFSTQEGEKICEDENGTVKHSIEMSTSSTNKSRKRKKSDTKGKRRSVTFATTARFKSDSISREIELNPTFNEEKNNSVASVNKNDLKGTESIIDLGMSVGLSIIRKENESSSESPIIKKICHSTPLVEHQKNKNVVDIALKDKPKQNHVFICPDRPARILRERSIENKTLQKSKRIKKDTGSNSDLEISTKKSNTSDYSTDRTDDFIYDVSIIPNTKNRSQKKMYHSTPINRRNSKKSTSKQKVSCNNTKVMEVEHIQHNDKMIQVSKTIFGSSNEGTGITASNKNLLEFSVDDNTNIKETRSISKRKSDTVYSDAKRMKETESSLESRSYHSNFVSTLESDNSYTTRRSEKRVAFKSISSSENTTTTDYRSSTSDSSYYVTRNRKSVGFREVISLIDESSEGIYSDDIRDIDSNRNLSIINCESIENNMNHDLPGLDDDSKSQMERTNVTLNYAADVPEIILTENVIEESNGECSLYNKVKKMSQCQKPKKKSSSRNDIVQKTSSRKQVRADLENVSKFIDSDCEVLEQVSHEKWVSPVLIQYLNEKLCNDDLDHVINTERIISLLCSAVSAVKNLQNVSDIDLALLPLKNVLVNYNICFNMITYYTFISRFTPLEFQRKALPLGGYFGSLKLEVNKKLIDPILTDAEKMNVIL